MAKFVFVRIKSAQDVQDIVHDVFFRLSRTEEDLSFLSDVDARRAYLRSLANNLITDRFRKINVRRKYEPLPGEEIGDPTDTIGPDQKLLAERDIELVKQVLWSLPEDVRRAFIMNRIQYKTYNQIGEELSLPVKRVEKLITKALHTLRKKVKPPL